MFHTVPWHNDAAAAADDDDTQMMRMQMINSQAYHILTAFIKINVIIAHAPHNSFITIDVVFLNFQLE